MVKKKRAARRDTTLTRSSIFIPPRRKFKWDTLHTALVMAVMIHLVLLTVFAIFRYEVKHKDAITEVYEVEMVPLAQPPSGGGGGGGGNESEPQLEEQAPVAYQPQSLVQPEEPRQYVPRTYNAPVVPVQPAQPRQVQQRPGSGQSASNSVNAGGGQGDGQGSGNGSGTGPGSGTGTGGGHGSGTGTGTGSGTGPGQGGGTGGGMREGSGYSSSSGVQVKAPYLPSDSSYIDEYRNGRVAIPNSPYPTHGYNGEPRFSPGKEFLKGWVTLRIKLDENGMTEWAKVEKSDGDPHEVELVRNLASGYKYESPVKVDGSPVSVELLLDLDYQFDKRDFR
jgi:outer membrane biosynthesis protein TonB